MLPELLGGFCRLLVSNLRYGSGQKAFKMILLATTFITVFVNLVLERHHEWLRPCTVRYSTTGATFMMFRNYAARNAVRMSR